MPEVEKDAWGILHAIYLQKKGDNKASIRHFTKVKARSTDPWTKSICNQNIRRMKGKHDSDYPRPSFGENYFPSVDKGDQILDKIIDDTDPLFAKNVTIFQGEGATRFELNNGDEKLTLWLTDRPPPIEKTYENLFEHKHRGEQKFWFIRGL